METVVDAMNDRAFRNKMKLNVKKTEDMWICFKDSILEPPSLTIDDAVIQRVNSFELLGLHVNNSLKWNTHIDEIV